MVYTILLLNRKKWWPETSRGWPRIKLVDAQQKKHSASLPDLKVGKRANSDLKVGEKNGLDLKVGFVTESGIELHILTWKWEKPILYIFSLSGVQRESAFCYLHRRSSFYSNIINMILIFLRISCIPRGSLPLASFEVRRKISIKIKILF